MKPGEPFSPYRMFLCAPVPLALMTLQKVSAGAKLLFGRLMLHAGEKTTCYPGLDCLARELGVSIDTVSRWMRELIDGEFIRRRRRGPGMNAECEFIWHPDLAPSLAGDDSAGPGNQDSAKLRNQEADSAKSQRPPDSAEVGCKIPQNRGADSADSRSDYKEQAVHEMEKTSTTATSSTVSGNAVNPAARKNDAEAVYVDRIKRRFLERGIVGSRFKASDERLARELFHQGVSIERVEHAILLGSVRKCMSVLNRGSTERIMSLQYFANLLNDAELEQTSPGYWKHIERKLISWEQQIAKGGTKGREQRSAS